MRKLLLILLTMATVTTAKTVTVYFTENAPRIDGVIEDVWQQADSAYAFVQYVPYEKAAPSEKTVVYVLQDGENIYFAFRCYAIDHKPVASPTGDEDNVFVKIDPFGSRTSGYYFRVFASEQMWDGWLHDDGRTNDDSWEGVWYSGVKLYEDRYEVEIKIPYKSIRYKHGLNAWGVQFQRHIPFIGEDDFWTEVLQAEGDLISKWGLLTSVEPRVAGYHFELYPEAYVRYDRDVLSDASDFRPRLSLNLKWDLTSQMTLNSTIYPDFAHIESDPFTLNLDRYPVYLQERRPFFLEGADIFRMSDFGPGRGFFQPLNIFYSRRIGKSIDGDAVPIIAGLKLTNKSACWNAGVLAVRTTDYSYGDTLIEPARWFGTIRAKRRILANSDFGILLSGAMVNSDSYSYAAGFDGVYRRGASQFIIQGAASDRNGKKGWAFASGYMGDVGVLRTMGAAEVVHDSFDVTEVGFVPWSGREKLTLYTGPFIRFDKGVVRTVHIAGGIKAVKEAGNSEWSKLGVLLFNPIFRNNISTTLQFLAGPYYEADTNYLRKEMLLSMYGNVFGYWLQINSSVGYMYNYYQGFLAYRSSTSLFYSYAFTPLINPGVSVNLWVEWDTLNAIATVTPRLRPYITFFFNGDTRLEVFNEMIFDMPHGALDDAALTSNRFGFLFSWRFRPKSWLYIALNDYREQDDLGSLEPQYQISAIKAKYLLYF